MPLTEATMPATPFCSERFTASEAPAVKPGRNRPNPKEAKAKPMMMPCRSWENPMNRQPPAPSTIPHNIEDRGPICSNGISPHWASNVAAAPDISTIPVIWMPIWGSSRKPRRSSTRKPTTPRISACALPPNMPVTSHGLILSSPQRNCGGSEASSSLRSSSSFRLLEEGAEL